MTETVFFRSFTTIYKHRIVFTNFVKKIMVAYLVVIGLCNPAHQATYLILDKKLGKGQRLFLAVKRELFWGVTVPPIKLVYILPVITSI